MREGRCCQMPRRHDAASGGWFYALARACTVARGRMRDIDLDVAFTLSSQNGCHGLCALLTPLCLNRVLSYVRLPPVFTSGFGEMFGHNA